MLCRPVCAVYQLVGSIHAGVLCIVASLQKRRYAESREYVSRADGLPLKLEIHNLPFNAEIEHAKNKPSIYFKSLFGKNKLASKSMHGFHHQNPSNRNPQNIGHSLKMEMSGIR